MIRAHSPPALRDVDGRRGRGVEPTPAGRGRRLVHSATGTGRPASFEEAKGVIVPARDRVRGLLLNSVRRTIRAASATPRTGRPQPPGHLCTRAIRDRPEPCRAGGTGVTGPRRRSARKSGIRRGGMSPTTSSSPDRPVDSIPGLAAMGVSRNSAYERNYTSSSRRGPVRHYESGRAGHHRPRGPRTMGHRWSASAQRTATVRPRFLSAGRGWLRAAAAGVWRPGRPRHERWVRTAGT